MWQNSVPHLLVCFHTSPALSGKHCKHSKIQSVRSYFLHTTEESCKLFDNFYKISCELWTFARWHFWSRSVNLTVKLVKPIFITELKTSLLQVKIFVTFFSSFSISSYIIPLTKQNMLYSFHLEIMCAPYNFSQKSSPKLIWNKKQSSHFQNVWYKKKKKTLSRILYLVGGGLIIVNKKKTYSLWKS